MRRLLSLRNLAVVLILIGVTSCKTTGLEQLRTMMDSYGYTLYDPPRSNHGPGWTFRMARTYDGKTVPITVCENLYPALQPKPADVSFPDTKVESEVNVDFAVELLEGLIKNVGEAKASLKSKGAESVKITWGGGAIRAEELLPQNTFTPSGSKIEVDSTCAAHLTDLKKKGEFADSIFMVQQAIKVEQMNFEATANSEKGGGLSLSLKDVLSVKPDVKVSEASTNTLAIKEPRYLGFRAFVITDVVPTGLLGPATAVVSGRQLSRAETATLFRN